MPLCLQKFLGRTLSWIPGFQTEKLNSSLLKLDSETVRIKFHMQVYQHLEVVKFRFVHHGDIMPLMDKSSFTLEISGKDFICNSPKN